MKTVATKFPAPFSTTPTENENEKLFVRFYCAAMAGIYSNFEMPKGEFGLAIIPGVSYQEEEEGEKDIDIGTWDERRSKHLAERCTLAATHAMEQLELFRTKQELS
jgi:hypothetical protein